MRKINLILVFLCFCMTTSIHAQINIVPTVGLNLYEIKSDIVDFAFDGGVGFNVGLDLRIGDDFILQPGIHYYQLKSELNTLIGTTEITQESVRIPVMIGGGIGDSESLQLRLLVGGLAAFQMKVNNDGGFSKDDYKPATFSAIGGVGVDISRLALGLTYEYGLSEVLENGEGTRNNIASLTLGFVF